MIYIITETGKFFEFDLATRQASLIGDLKALEPTFKDKMFFYGHDARVGNRFYFSAFSRTGNALLVGIDPVRLKAAIAKTGVTGTQARSSRPSWRPSLHNITSFMLYLFHDRSDAVEP